MVYYDVLADVGGTVVMCGWDMRENNQHLIDQLFRKQKTKVAVSVYLPGVKDLEGHCHRIREAILDASPSRRKTEVSFFSAESDGCWVHPRAS